jgi:hypothetical protein
MDFIVRAVVSRLCHLPCFAHARATLSGSISHLYKHTKPRKAISATFPLRIAHLMNHRHAITMPSKRSTNLQCIGSLHARPNGLIPRGCRWGKDSPGRKAEPLDLASAPVLYHKSTCHVMSKVCAMYAAVRRGVTTLCHGLAPR